MINRFSITMGFMLFLVYIPLCGNAKANLKSRKFMFENESEKHFTSLPENSLSLSNRHFKDGKSSLMWRSTPGAVIRFRDTELLPIAEKNQHSGIKIWIYNEKPDQGYLSFDFYTEKQDKGKSKYSFKFNLNFKGWRAGWVSLKSDSNFDPSVTGPPVELKIRSCSTWSLDLYLDHMEITDYVHFWRSKDAQVCGKTSKSTNNVNNASSVKKETAPVTKAEIEACAVIEKRVSSWLSGSPNACDSKYGKILYERILATVPGAIRIFKSFNITREDGNIKGVPLFTVIYSDTPKVNTLFNDAVFPLALAYSIKGPADIPNPYYQNPTIKQMVLDAFDHASDQGWAANSSMGTSVGAPMGMSGFNFALFLMRDVLSKAGILNRELATFRYYSGFDALVSYPDIPGGSADVLRALSLFRLFYILSLDDNQKKVTLMRLYKRFMDNSLSVVYGRNALVKPDYGVFAHWALYWNGYGANALNFAALLSYFLRETPFEVKDTSWENLKKCLLTMRFAANTYDFPLPLNGRWPFWQNGLVQALNGYAYAAAVKNPPDRELGMAFKRLFRPELKAVKDNMLDLTFSGNQFSTTLGNLESINRILDNLKDLPGEAAPVGHKAMPYGGTSFHRRKNWLVFVKGWSKYVWNFENGENVNNLLGRNLSHGFLGIYGGTDPASMIGSGYNWEGWDWQRFPGTTVERLGFNDFSKFVPHRVYTDQTFVGGVTDGSNGVFVLSLHDSPYNKTFYAKKTYFFNDDFVLALGSGIRNSSTKGETETILLQSYLHDSTAKTVVNGKDVTSCSWEFAGNGETVTILDSHSNGYFVPNSKGLSIYRQNQSFPKRGRWTGSSGNYEVAVIKHGKAPVADKYEYAVLPQTNQEKLASFSSKPPYLIMKHDDTAHIVAFEGKKVNYAIFDPEHFKGGGVIKQVNRPCLIMTETKGDHITITACDPDIGAGWHPDLSSSQWFKRFIEIGNKPRELIISLAAGKWNIDKSNNADAGRLSSASGKTKLIFDCQDGKSYSARIKKMLNH